MSSAPPHRPFTGVPFLCGAGGIGPMDNNRHPSSFGSHAALHLDRRLPGPLRKRRKYLSVIGRQIIFSERKSLSYRKWHELVFAERVCQGVERSPSRTVSGGDDLETKVTHGFDGIRYDLLVTPRQMKSAHDRIEWNVFKTASSMMEDVNHTRMRACREHDDALLCNIHRNEALIHDQFIEFPSPDRRESCDIDQEGRVRRPSRAGFRRLHTRSDQTKAEVLAC
jgi:hypothetical protein